MLDTYTQSGIIPPAGVGIIDPKWEWLYGKCVFYCTPFGGVGSNQPLTAQKTQNLPKSFVHVGDANNMRILGSSVGPAMEFSNAGSTQVDSAECQLWGPDTFNPVQINIKTGITMLVVHQADVGGAGAANADVLLSLTGVSLTWKRGDSKYRFNSGFLQTIASGVQGDKTDKMHTIVATSRAVPDKRSVMAADGRFIKQGAIGSVAETSHIFVAISSVPASSHKAANGVRGKIALVAIFDAFLDIQGATALSANAFGWMPRPDIPPIFMLGRRGTATMDTGPAVKAYVSVGPPICDALIDAEPSVNAWVDLQEVVN